MSQIPINITLNATNHTDPINHNQNPKPNDVTPVDLISAVQSSQVECKCKHTHFCVCIIFGTIVQQTLGPPFG